MLFSRLTLISTVFFTVLVLLLIPVPQLRSQQQDRGKNQFLVMFCLFWAQICETLRQSVFLPHIFFSRPPSFTGDGQYIKYRSGVKNRRPGGPP